MKREGNRFALALIPAIPPPVICVRVNEELRFGTAHISTPAGTDYLAA